MQIGNINNTKGITLIALIITIILMLILAGVVINLTIGENGLFKMAKKAGQDYKVAGILEKLEIEKSALIMSKNGEKPSAEEYIDYIIQKEIITIADVENISDTSKNIVLEGNIFSIEETNNDIKISYQSKADGKPRIAKILVKEVTPNSIKVEIMASQVNGGKFEYSIKNVTTGETTYTTKASNIQENEYEFTGLIQENEYMVLIKVENDKGKDEKETETAIKAELPEVSSITLNKNTLTIPKGMEETIVATVLPINAKDTTITWTSSNNEIVVVNENGKVTAMKEGTATITATANGGTRINATCEITVTPPPPPTAGVGSDTHTAKELQYTWEELEKIAKVISDNYGDEKGKINKDTLELNVSVNGKADTIGVGDWATVNGKKVKILGFNHDDLVTTTTNEQGETIPWTQYGEGTTNTKAGISFEFVDYLGKTKAEYTAKAGWGNSAIRNTVSSFKNSLENTEQIKQVKKKYTAIYNDPTSVTTSNDYLWLLSASEIWDTGCGERYKYYINDSLYDTCAYLKGTANITTYYWLRSGHYSVASYICLRKENTCSWTNSSPSNYLSPGFAI